MALAIIQPAARNALFFIRILQMTVAAAAL
jgi:hypothetical protein